MLVLGIRERRVIEVHGVKCPRRHEFSAIAIRSKEGAVARNRTPEAAAQKRAVLPVSKPLSYRSQQEVTLK